MFAILQAFSSDRSALTLSEVSRLAGLPISTTRRVLSELTRFGALDRGVDLRYRVGYRLRELAQLAVMRSDLQLAT